jgi:hypothetical protein
VLLFIYMYFVVPRIYTIRITVRGNIITINVPLFKKLRDIILFCGTITL